MSIKATVETRCPGGCEPIEADVWSFVRGDKDENLRDRLLVGELNLTLCDECGKHFTPEAPLVYLDPTKELLAFVFPTSYEKEAERWRTKMAEDFKALREAYGDEMAVEIEPLQLFGLDALTTILREDDTVEDEVEVAEYYCGTLSLSVARVSRGFSRSRRLPRILPYAGASFSRDAAVRGVRALLEANDRLTAFEGWLSYLESPEPDPPLEGR